jgi:dipeptidyl-peptidase-4
MRSIFFLFIFVSLSATAQEKLFTMEEAVVKQRSSLAPEKLTQLGWIPGTNSYSYIRKSNGTEEIVIGDAGSNKTRAVLTLPSFNEAIREQNIAAFSSFPGIKWNSAKSFDFAAAKTAWSFDLNAKKASNARTRDFGNAEHIDISPVSGYAAFTLSNNLYVHDGKEKLIVTNDADENIVNGRSVHREEFGITKGTFWSPKGSLLAFYRMDQTMVNDYPIIDWSGSPAVNKNIKYPMAGDKSHEVTIGIYNVATGKTLFLRTGEPKDQYMTNICWSPDEQHVYVAIVNREQNQMQLNSYSAVTGYFERTILEERNEKYVHPMHPMTFVPGNDKQFIWQSERDGFNHLYLYDLSGKLIRQLTKGSWIVTELHGFDNKAANVYYSATAESPITRNLYRCDLKTGKQTRLTTGDGTHTILFQNGNVIDNFQSMTTPRETATISSKGTRSVLFTAPDPLASFARGQTKLFTIKSDAGTDLYCRLIKPVNFDSTKKYPVIVYLYGGPGIQMINNTWNAGGDLWFQLMAEKGFVVFTVDSRGSANRGLAFEQSTFRHFGEVETEDQMKGVEYLKSLPYVDAARMGVFGWSYGGFVTTSLMTRYPGTFKAAVAGGPVMDWNIYEVMYTERYMDTPQENPEGYKNSRLIDQVDKIQGKLMIIHGAQDNVVVLQHSIQFLKACVDKKKQVDFFIYPGHEHNVLGKDREHLYQKVTDYFIQNL